jgi:hypothetical protein
MGFNFDFNEGTKGNYDSLGFQVGQDYLHNLIHKGDVFFVSHIFRAVPNNGKVYIRHKSGSTVYLHSELTANSTGKCRITSYSGTTYSNNGTVKSPINRKSDSTYVVQSQFWITPTITLLGTPRLDLLFGSGTNPSQSSTGVFSERLESLFAPNTDVLIEYTNESGQAQDLSVYLNAYETIV